MRKLSVLLTVALVLALAVPAFAGVSTDITGKVTTKLEYKDGDVSGTGSVNAKVALSAGSEGAARAILDITAWEAKADGAFGAATSPFTANYQHDILKVNSAYLQTEGAWFKNGPAVTTSIGRFANNVSDWVGNFGARDAVRVSGLDLGATSLAGYYAFVNHATDDVRIRALSGSANLDVVELSGAFVTTIDADVAANTFSDYVVVAGVTPADGVKATFAYASDGSNDATAYKLNTSLETIPNLKFGFDYWSTATAFSPVYARYADDKPVAFMHRTWDHPTKTGNGSIGYKLSASMTQSGLDLSGSHQNETLGDGTALITTTIGSVGTTVSDTTLKATLTAKSDEANSKLVASAARTFGNVEGSYELTSTHAATIEHRIKATTTVNTAFADAVALSGAVALVGGASNADLDAGWTAPNGIDLGLHFANYAGGDYAEGFSARAGYELEF
jgi:hypothetical protein